MENIAGILYGLTFFRKYIAKMEDEEQQHQQQSSNNSGENNPMSSLKKKLSRKSDRKKSGRNKTQVLPGIISGTLSRKKNKHKKQLRDEEAGDLTENTRVKSTSCLDLANMENEVTAVLSSEQETEGCDDAVRKNSVALPAASATANPSARDSGYDDSLINGLPHYQRKESIVSECGDFEVFRHYELIKASESDSLN